MLKIALTGGVGVGKSYIANKFERMQFPIYHADDETKKFYQKEEVKNLLRNAFGEAAFSDNTIDFKKLGDIIFSDPKHLKTINKIIHPIIIESFEHWAKCQSSSIVFMESALVFESKFQHIFDLVIVVNASTEKRIERVLHRNPELTENEIQRRFSSQIPQEEKCRKSDVIIDNEIDNIDTISYSSFLIH